ncbi:MAG: MarR family transcriptional regulator [Archaeoglobaceae archaeon]|nr:MarR family transcriptional regulator [Archaeoglobaceae archaeon]MCX8152572.1 MarR family transcriptional regulator [Archaeoglobaceae archaeon]MDW8014146.1 MarR family transcriptional regulator [Archaeoglobaceae archaeon]
MIEFKDTKDEVLRIIKERGGVLQKDLWKELNIDSSKCSRILRKLEKDGLVKRIEVVVDGVKTFKIVPVELLEGKKDEELDLRHILERPDASFLPPCFACLERSCEATSCLKLEAWFLNRCRSPL